MINISDSAYGRITSSFGLRASPTAGASSDHKGVDIVLKDSSVPAVATGVVTESAYDSARGYYITLLHSDGSLTRYQHLKEAALFNVGDMVHEGEKIGTQGSTGISTGDHLHFEVRNSMGEAVDPVEYLNGGSVNGSLLDSLKSPMDYLKDGLSVIVKFVSMLLIAILAAFLFLKAFDISIL